jgi:hypothetical protein
MQTRMGSGLLVSDTNVYGVKDGGFDGEGAEGPQRVVAEDRTFLGGSNPKGHRGRRQEGPFRTQHEMPHSTFGPDQGQRVQLDLPLEHARFGLDIIYFQS